MIEKYGLFTEMNYWVSVNLLLWFVSGHICPAPSRLILFFYGRKFLDTWLQSVVVFSDLRLTLGLSMFNVFLVADTRLYKPLCRLVGRSVGLSVRHRVTPAHPSATNAAVYTALLVADLQI